MLQRQRLGLAVAAALLLFVSLLFGAAAAYQLEQTVQHTGEYRSNRTWTVNYEFILCGQIKITRIDRQRMGLGELPTLMPHQRFSIQWNYQPNGDFTLLQMMVAMSQEHHMVRVFVQTPTGTAVKYFFFTIYGGSREQIGPLPDLTEADLPILAGWMMAHEWTPPSPHNPRRGAFELYFPKLSHQLDSRMDFGVQIAGPGCGQRELEISAAQMILPTL